MKLTTCVILICLLFKKHNIQFKTARINCEKDFFIFLCPSYILFHQLWIYQMVVFRSPTYRCMAGTHTRLVAINQRNGRFYLYFIGFCLALWGYEKERFQLDEKDSCLLCCISYRHKCLFYLFSTPSKGKNWILIMHL